jgi:hypothetical protein
MPVELCACARAMDPSGEGGGVQRDVLLARCLLSAFYWSVGPRPVRELVDMLTAGLAVQLRHDGVSLHLRGRLCCQRVLALTHRLAHAAPLVRARAAAVAWLGAACERDGVRGGSEAEAAEEEMGGGR